MSEIPADSALEYLIPVRYDAADHSLTISIPACPCVRETGPSGPSRASLPTGRPGSSSSRKTRRPGFSDRSPAWRRSRAGSRATAAPTWRASPSPTPIASASRKASGSTGRPPPRRCTCSQQATILVHEREQPPVRTFHVRSEGEGKLAVEPLGVPLRTGETVEWIFDVPGDPELLASAHQLRPLYGDRRGAEPTPRPHLPALRTGQSDGLGNSGVPETYFFEVSLISLATGQVEWIGSGDPAIDNMGPIWDPVSGGPAR